MMLSLSFHVLFAMCIFSGEMCLKFLVVLKTRLWNGSGD